MVTTREEVRSGPGVGAAVLAFAVFGLIAAGSVLVARRHGEAGGEGRSSGTYSESADGGRIEMVAFMRQAGHRSETHSFRSAELVTIAGSGSLDLTGARMASDSGRLEVVVIGGRAVVRVPPDWEVVSKDSLAAGRLDNRARRAAGEVTRERTRTLRLEAVVLGGRLEVTH